MKVVLEINLADINTNLLDIISAMFKKDISEIIVKKNDTFLQEFDKSLSVNDVVKSLKEYGYKSELIQEIKEGLEESSVYVKK